MKEQLITKIIINAEKYMSVDELKEFRVNLDCILEEYKVEIDTKDIVVYNAIPSCVKEYIVSRKIEGVAVSSLEQYARVLNNFFLTVRKDITKITTSDIRSYLFYNQQQTNNSDRTMDFKRTIICTFFKWCNSEGYIDKNPCVNIRPIKYTRKPRQPLSSVEMERIRNACSTIRDRAMVEFLYSTGCRVSEMVNVNVSDINFKTGEVVLLGKGNKYRTSFISDKAMYYLLTYLNSKEGNSSQVFTSKRKPYKPLKKCGIEKIIKDIGKEANLDRPLYPHLFRHTIATDCLQKGMNVADIQSLLGHASVATTMVYAKVDTNDLKNKHKRITA